jgi:ABC-type antimicrobial peptide transport system permease subunit
MLGSELPQLSSFPLYFISMLAAFALITGYLAGIYPALVLSSLRSVDSLKGALKSVKENILLRKLLVGFQFFTATVVLIGAIIISQQISLFFSKDLGYDKDYIISAQLPRDWSLKGVEHMEMIREEFAAMPELEQTTLSYEIPNGNNAGAVGIYKAGSDSTRAVVSQVLTTDEHYSSTYKIALAAGAFFHAGREKDENDSTRIVINAMESTALGWKDPHQALGQQVKLTNSNMIFTISGVTRDFHFGAMGSPIQPCTFLHVYLNNSYRYLSFRLRPGNIGQGLAALQKKWAVLLPGAPFEYNFMDENLQKLYKSELQLRKSAYTATILALIIVLLGVLGLISLSIQKRTREIAVRKVIGSSVSGILVLFIREFLPLLFLSGIIASPLAYFIMQGWLHDYAYRIAITPLPFLVSVFSLGTLTAALIVIQTIRAALANPAKSLRTE